MDGGCHLCPCPVPCTFRGDNPDPPGSRAVLALPRCLIQREHCVFLLEGEDGIDSEEPREGWQLLQPAEKLEELLELHTIPLWSVALSLLSRHVAQALSLSSSPLGNSMGKCFPSWSYGRKNPSFQLGREQSHASIRTGTIPSRSYGRNNPIPILWQEKSHPQLGPEQSLSYGRNNLISQSGQEKSHP